MKNLSIKNKTKMSKKKKRGFTLVELIIVIAIIAILAAIAIPKFGQIRENANQKADIATAKNIATIVAQEVSDGNISASNTVGGTGDTVKDQLDGDSEPKALAAGSETTFYYEIDSSTGNITIYYGDDATGEEVYPEYNAS